MVVLDAKKGELPAYTLLRHGKKEGSVELRMYPKDLVKKGKDLKDLIYCYTVYTPQEEMNQILYESKDTRLKVQNN